MIQAVQAGPQEGNDPGHQVDLVAFDQHMVGFDQAAVHYQEQGIKGRSISS